MSEEKRIYSIHSQKGGVGKTSIAIAIAGWEKLKMGRRVIIIDADLTGTSLIDLWGNFSKKDRKVRYLNELLLAAPIDFNGYFKKDMLKLFFDEYDYEGIKYIPSSPLFKDVSKIVPLISQEDNVHFFKYRLGGIFHCLFKEFDSIVIDLPPGLFGISKAVLNLKKDISSWNQNDKKNTYRNMTILVTTSEPNDYMALIPSFSEIITELEIKNAVKLVLNKAYLKDTKSRFDEALAFTEIVNEIKQRAKESDNQIEFSDGRKIDQKTWDLLIESQKASQEGVIAAKFESNFRVRDIIYTINELIEKRKTQKDTKLKGMEGWVATIEMLMKSIDNPLDKKEEK